MPARPKEGDPQVEQLISDLKAWCDARRGRRTYLAKIIGVDRKRITDWFTGRVQPSLSAGLKIQAFLEGEKSGRGDKTA
jgi:DNA-binding XRE family transcriptional regulator